MIMKVLAFVFLPFLLTAASQAADTDPLMDRISKQINDDLRRITSELEVEIEIPDPLSAIEVEIPKPEIFKKLAVHEALEKRALERKKPEDLFELASALYLGLYGVSDPKRAVALTEQAHNKGYLPATAAMGAYYLDDLELKVNTDKALAYLEPAADKGSSFAYMQLGRLYLMRAGKRGFPQDPQGMGMLLKRGEEVDAETRALLAQSYKWYEKADQTGDFDYLREYGPGMQAARISFFLKPSDLEE